MAGQSRIKFNPVTKEIEIEGSEQFVKTYFDKIQSLLSAAQEVVTAAPVKTKEIKSIKEKPAKKIRKSKKDPVVAVPIIEQLSKKIRQSKKAQKVVKKEKLETGIKRGDISKTVLTLIQDSPEGITTTELKEKTGLMEKQIWAITSKAKKAGKIKQGKRGLYISA